MCHNTAKAKSISLSSNLSLQLKITLNLKISYWNQQNRSPAYILHPSTKTFEGIYQYRYGPDKSPLELCLCQYNTLQLPQLTVKSYATPQVYVHTVYQHCIAISALPGELICSLTTWLSHVAGMELQVPACGTQVAATPKCAIFCAVSSRSVVFHVLYCVVNFVAVG